MRDQILGCIIGGAIGDAFGRPYERLQPPIVISDNEEAYSGALAVVAAVRAAAGGLWNDSNDLLRLVIDVLPDTQVRDRLVAMAEVEKETPLRDIAFRFGSSGFVAESVPLALCGASRIRSYDFKTVLIDLISCGGDTDTIASIAGQVAGALIGRSRLPDEMIARIPDLDEVETVARGFAESLNFYD